MVWYLTTTTIFLVMCQGMSSADPMKRNLAESVYWGDPSLLDLQDNRSLKDVVEEDSQDVDESQLLEKLSTAGEKEEAKYYEEESDDQDKDNEKRTRFTMRPWGNSAYRRLRYLYNHRMRKPRAEEAEEKAKEDNAPAKKRLLFVPWKATWSDLLRDVVDTPEYKEQVSQIEPTPEPQVRTSLLKKGLLNNSLWKFYLNMSRTARSPKDSSQPSSPVKTAIIHYADFKPRFVRI